MRGEGVALAPRLMFEPELAEGRLVAPFALDVRTGAYWLTRLASRRVSDGMQAFRDWILEASGRQG
jgi:LysR family transcriptional regulator of beta-lactamase